MSKELGLNMLDGRGRTSFDEVRSLPVDNPELYLLKHANRKLIGADFTQRLEHQLREVEEVREGWSVW